MRSEPFRVPQVPQRIPGGPDEQVLVGGRGRTVRYDLVEVHGLTGEDCFAGARRHVAAQVPGATVLGAAFTGARCAHGPLLVRVGYLLPQVPGSGCRAE
jgi:hypothetical protein